jgi:hypothetical protein
MGTMTSIERRVVRLLAYATLTGLLILATSAPAAAIAIYTYTGNTFTAIGTDDPPSDDYTTSMRVEGEFTLDHPLVRSPRQHSHPGSISSLETAAI